LSVVAAPDSRDDAPIADAAARGAPTMEMSRFVSLAVAHAGPAGRRELVGPPGALPPRQ
jgi:hypothetical protein